MIGEVRTSIVPFYDPKKRQLDKKARPCLVIGKADNSDYIILPISRVTAFGCIDGYYDIPLDPSLFPLLNLSAKSYIRTHKQQVVHYGSMGKLIADFKGNYEDTYLEVVSKVEEFQKNLIDKAI